MKITIKIITYIAIFLLICFVISLFFIEAMKKNSWMEDLWGISIYQIDNSSNSNNIEIVYNDENNSFFINWYLKSWFINDNIIYLWFFIPFTIYSENTDITYDIFRKYNENEDNQDFSNDYFYIVYYIKNNELLYLNLDKEIIYWNSNIQLDKESLDKLDKSNFVDIWNIEFSTYFDIDNYSNIKHIELINQAYQKLMHKIN